MLPTMPAQANKQERKLIKIFKSLDEINKESFLAFGEFLQSRAADSDKDDKKAKALSELVDIPRPKEESVIKAIKRLSATYPMVDKENILHPISDLMTSHMISGRSASDVIDDLQDVFSKEYETINSE